MDQKAYLTKKHSQLEQEIANILRENRLHLDEKQEAKLNEIKKRKLAIKDEISKLMQQP